MNRIISDRGSVLMEFVIVAPMLLLLIFGIIQFAYIFMAKQLTFYAAYSAARTALVYNPKDYRDNSGTGAFYSNKGPLYLAACTIMSWMNAGDGDSSFIYFPRAGADVWNQVKIEGEQFLISLDFSGNQRIISKNKSFASPTGSYASTNEYQRRSALNVTVHYFCPMFIPVVSDILAYALTGSDVVSYWSLLGFMPQNALTLSNEMNINSGKVVRYGSIPMIHLQESCMLFQPYPSETFALIPDEDRAFFKLGD